MLRHHDAVLRVVFGMAECCSVLSFVVGVSVALLLVLTAQV